MYRGPYHSRKYCQKTSKIQLNRKKRNLCYNSIIYNHNQPPPVVSREVLSIYSFFHPTYTYKYKYNPIKNFLRCLFASSKNRKTCKWNRNKSKKEIYSYQSINLPLIDNQSSKTLEQKSTS